MKKNILFITVDQWRGDCLSAVGHPLLKTPNLDALANDGVLFKQHYAQATPCGPARASLYTGLYMHNHRSLLNGMPLDARHTNMAIEARKMGYKPALFGYTDTCLDPRQFSHQDYTLQTYESPLPGFYPVCHVDSIGKNWLADLKEKGYQFDSAKDMLRPAPEILGIENKGKTFAPAKFKAEDSRAAFLVGEAIKYLSVRQDKPWFVHMSFLSPHPPYIAPEPFHEQYNADDMPLPNRHKTPQKEASLHPWIEYYIFKQSGTNYTDGALACDNISLSDKELCQIKATYLGMMSELDSQIGKLIHYLKEINAYDNTLIIFTSDHGDMQGDHWMLSKPGPFDQAFHIPLIVRDPSSEADKSRGSQVEAFTESIDIMPTILDVIGQDIPVQCDGYSLLPFSRDQQPKTWRQEYHAEFDLRSPYNSSDKVPFGLEQAKCMVNIIRGERYKYVHFSGLPPLFFDLKDDPHEYINRYNDPDYQSRVLEYVAKMLTWRMEHDEAALTDIHLGDE
jgi:arylsulfatase A-like enzyme